MRCMSNTRVITNIGDVSQYQYKIQMYIDVSRFSQYVCIYRSRGAQRCAAVMNITAISSYATAEAIWMTFPFLEPWEGTVWIHTDKNRYYTGAQISQGEQKPYLCSRTYLLSPWLWWKAPAHTSCIGLPELVVRSRAYAEDTPRTTSSTRHQNMSRHFKTCWEHKPLHKTSETLRLNLMHHWTHKGGP